MATHSSILAWRIPGTEEPGGLPSMGSHRVRHDWSDLAAAAFRYWYEKFLNSLSLTSIIRASEFLCVSPGVVSAQVRTVLQNMLLRAAWPLWASNSAQCVCVWEWGKWEYKRTGKSRGPGTEQSVNKCRFPFPSFSITCQGFLAWVFSWVRTAISSNAIIPQRTLLTPHLSQGACQDAQITLLDLCFV